MWRDYLAFYKTRLPDAQFDYTWSQIMAGTIHCRLARLDGHPIGLVHFLYHESAWTMQPTCYLQDLYTDPVSRGTGVGRALIENVAADARTKGASRMYWLTQSENAPARLLYDRLAKYSGYIRYDYPLAKRTDLTARPPNRD